MSEAGQSLLFVGGTRSGKSGMAQHWAESVASDRIFVATSRVEDEETAQRVARHQLERGAGWSVLEVPLDLVESLDSLSRQNGVVLVDCITMWITNLMGRNLSDTRILELVDALCKWVQDAPLPVALVSGEVGQGIVPMTPLGRRFRDLLGDTNQMLASACTTVILVNCGLPLPLKGKMPEELCVVS